MTVRNSDEYTEQEAGIGLIVVFMDAETARAHRKYRNLWQRLRCLVATAIIAWSVEERFTVRILLESAYKEI